MAFLSTGVRDYRYKLMRELMDREGYDALAFTSEDFFQFATNFHTDVRTWERPIVCIVPRNGEPFVLLNELSTFAWRYTLEAGRLWATDTTFYAEHVRVRNRIPLASQWTQVVADLLKQRGLHHGLIGVEFWERADLARALPAASPAPGGGDRRVSPNALGEV